MIKGKVRKYLVENALKLEIINCVFIIIFFFPRQMNVFFYLSSLWWTSDLTRVHPALDRLSSDIYLKRDLKK